MMERDNSFVKRRRKDKLLFVGENLLQKNVGAILIARSTTAYHINVGACIARPKCMCLSDDQWSPLQVTCATIYVKQIPIYL